MNSVNENSQHKVNESNPDIVNENNGTAFVSGYTVSPQNCSRESVYVENMKNRYLHFAGLSLLYGLIYTACMYRNPAGITFPLLVLLTLIFAGLCMKFARIDKVKSTPYFIAILLLSISTCLTANSFFHFFNKVGIVMLFSAAMLHQIYEDGKWTFPVYLRNMFVLWGNWIVSIGSIFSHAVSSHMKGHPERRKRAVAVLSGIGLAALMLVIVLPLLISSDLIIANYAELFLRNLSFGEGFGIAVNIIAGILLFYAFFAALFKHNLRDTTENEYKKAESLTGITFVFILAVIYALYVVVQIVFLFLRAGKLPGDLTYSQYAHEGFWQLLAVSIINIVMILICMQVFQKHKLLNILLLVISLCTCVMTASAAYRMILYVSAYHLTFLRILVLWFLGVLALIMTGMMIAIFRTDFPLFRYSLVVVTCCYILLSFAGVDSLIASYNIRHAETMTMNDVRYIMYALSEDAAPYVAEIDIDEIEEIQVETDVYNAENTMGMTTEDSAAGEYEESEAETLKREMDAYFQNILDKEMPLRSWNYGRMRARAVAETYLKNN